MTDKPLETVLFRLVDIVDGMGIHYMLMGGMATRIWGLPRSTFDVDVTLSLASDALSGFCSRLEQAGFVVPEPHRKGFADTLKGMGKFSFQDYAFSPPILVDCFLPTTAYQREAISRRREVELEGRNVWVISPEDLILHKLVAGRPRDLDDIDDILLVQDRTMDLAYLRKWAAALGVTSLLNERMPKE